MAHPTAEPTTKASVRFIRFIGVGARPVLIAGPRRCFNELWIPEEARVINPHNDGGHPVFRAIFFRDTSC